jgi:hypothetical protein
MTFDPANPIGLKARQTVVTGHSWFAGVNFVGRRFKLCFAKVKNNKFLELVK